MADGGKKFTLDKDLFMTYYKTYEEFRKAKIVPPAEKAAAFLENDPQADPMASGVVMTRGATTGSVSALEQLMPGKVGVVNMPTGPSGGGWAQSTIFLSVSANSKHKDEAKRFLQLVHHGQGSRQDARADARHTDQSGHLQGPGADARGQG